MIAPRGWERWWLVDVDGWRVVTTARHRSDAVFSALRTIEFADETRDQDTPEKSMIGAELLPPKPPRMSKAAYTRQLKKDYNAR